MNQSAQHINVFVGRHIPHKPQRVVSYCGRIMYMAGRRLRLHEIGKIWNTTPHRKNKMCKPEETARNASHACKAVEMKCRHSTATVLCVCYIMSAHFRDVEGVARDVSVIHHLHVTERVHLRAHVVPVHRVFSWAREGGQNHRVGCGHAYTIRRQRR